jgi:hypothetical protein
MAPNGHSNHTNGRSVRLPEPGVFVPLLTFFKPVSEGEGVDVETTVKHAVDMARTGLGLVLLGTMGEGQSKLGFLSDNHLKSLDWQLPISLIPNERLWFVPSRLLSEKQGFRYLSSLELELDPLEKPSNSVSKLLKLAQIKWWSSHQDTMQGLWIRLHLNNSFLT